MVGREGREAGRWRECEKRDGSGDWSVEVEWMKWEWVVMGGEDSGVNRLGGVVERAGERMGVGDRRSR